MRHGLGRLEIPVHTSHTQWGDLTYQTVFVQQSQNLLILLGRKQSAQMVGLFLCRPSPHRKPGGHCPVSVWIALIGTCNPSSYHFISVVHHWQRFRKMNHRPRPVIARCRLLQGMVGLVPHAIEDHQDRGWWFVLIGGVSLRKVSTVVLVGWPQKHL